MPAAARCSARTVVRTDTDGLGAKSLRPASHGGFDDFASACALRLRRRRISRAPSTGGLRARAGEELAQLCARQQSSVASDSNANAAPQIPEQGSNGGTSGRKRVCERNDSARAASRTSRGGSCGAPRESGAGARRQQPRRHPVGAEGRAKQKGTTPPPDRSRHVAVRARSYLRGDNHPPGVCVIERRAYSANSPESLESTYTSASFLSRVAQRSACL